MTSKCAPTRCDLGSHRWPRNSPRTWQRRRESRPNPRRGLENLGPTWTVSSARDGGACPQLCPQQKSNRTQQRSLEAENLVGLQGLTDASGPRWHSLDNSWRSGREPRRPCKLLKKRQLFAGSSPRAPQGPPKACSSWKLSTELRGIRERVRSETARKGYSTLATRSTPSRAIALRTIGPQRVRTFKSPRRNYLHRRSRFSQPGAEYAGQRAVLLPFSQR
jgi:hypothetical protein